MKKKICFVVAVPGTAKSFLRDHIARLSQEYDVYLAGNIKNAQEVESLALKGWKRIGIRRGISIVNDLAAVGQLVAYFRKMKFDAVHSVTPKAGLVTALAGYMARLPIRIHIFTGQVWATKTGAMRQLLVRMDKLIARLDTHLLVDGKSQRRFLIENGVLNEGNSQVLGEGSICGVNTQVFAPSDDARNAARKKLGITDEKVVFVFMGRLNHDKGAFDLLEAFNNLAPDAPNAFLLLFGNDEENVAATFSNYPNLQSGRNFCYFGATDQPGQMLQAGDVFVLPTYREGFGSSVIEAQCLGLPAITSDAYGVVDATVDHKTAMRFPVGDVKSLHYAMKYMYDVPDDRRRMGQAGRQRVLNCFTGEYVVGKWLAFYHSLLS